jgi:tRNA-Thr(GGU) m(6)t(6)A37 methyltransferase TsaA
MPESQAIIHLREGHDFDEALDGLAGFERIWVVFEFHLNETWHPRVQPPREGEPRRGVFATRSPHRPNRIGLSCVRLLSIDGLQLTVAGHDLLDQTPVWDLKPYVPYADAFPEAQAGWLDHAVTQRYDVEFAPTAAHRAAWIGEHGKLDCVNFASVQLMTDPTDGERKRIQQQADGDYVIAYRTWRLQYCVSEESQSVTVTQVSSGYSEKDLAEADDRHGDKAVHRAFLALHPPSNLADSSSSP